MPRPSCWQNATMDAKQYGDHLAELKAWMATLPEGPPWALADSDPLIRRAVVWGFTTARGAKGPDLSAYSPADTQTARKWLERRLSFDLGQALDEPAPLTDASQQRITELIREWAP